MDRDLGLRQARDQGQLVLAPAAVEGAFDRIEAWSASSAAVVVESTAGHSTLVRSLLVSAGTAGNLVNDAHLAALSIEHRGRVVSYDSDFARFEGVRWTSPATA